MVVLEVTVGVVASEAEEPQRGAMVEMAQKVVMEVTVVIL